MNYTVWWAVCLSGFEKTCLHTKRAKTFPVSLSSYCRSASASLENSFHLLSHRWAGNHLLWTLVLSSNLVWAGKGLMIYWQIRQSGCQEMALYGFIFVLSSISQSRKVIFLKSNIRRVHKLQLPWPSWVAALPMNDSKWLECRKRCSPNRKKIEMHGIIYRSQYYIYISHVHHYVQFFPLHHSQSR